MANNPFTSHDLYAGGNELDALKAELAAINVEMTKLLTTAAQARAALVHLSTVKVQSQAQIISQATQAQALANKQQELAVRQSLKLDRMRALSAQQTASAVVAAQQRQAIGEERVYQAQNRTAISANQLAASEARLNNARKSSSGSLRGILSSLRTLTYAYFSLAAAQRIVGQLFTETKQLNTLDVAFKTTLGSIQDVAKAKEFLINISERLGVNLLTASNAYLKFGTAAKQAGLTQQTTNEIFESFAKASSVLGLGAERTSYVFLALEQIISKGKLQTEELRRQLGEHLPGAFGIAATAMGVTTAELTKMLKAGGIVSTEFLPKFAKQVEIAYGIQNVKRVDNLAAAQERFNNQVTLLIRKADAAGFFKIFFNTLAGGVRILGDNLKAVVFLSKAVVYLTSVWLAYRLSLALTNALQKIGIFQTAAAAAAARAQALATGAATVAQRSLSAAMAANPIGAVITAIVLLLPLLQTMVRYMTGVTDVAREMKGSLDAMTDGIIDETTAMDKNIHIITGLNSTSKERKKAIDDLKAAYPGILAKYDLEKASLADLIKLENDLTDAISNRAKESLKAENSKKLITSLAEAGKATVFAPLNSAAGNAAQTEAYRENLRKKAFADYTEGNLLIDQAADYMSTFLKANEKSAKSEDLIIDSKNKEIKLQKELNKLTNDQLLDILDTQSAKGRSFGATDAFGLRKKIAAEILDQRKANAPKEGDPGEKDKAFRKMIARLKKLQSYMDEGYAKDLEALRIQNIEELHMNEDGAKGVLEINDHYYNKLIPDLIQKYVLKRWKMQNDAQIDGQQKDIEGLKIWFEETKKEWIDSGKSLGDLEQDYRNRLVDIQNKYIDEKDAIDQQSFDNAVKRTEAEFELRQKTFRSNAAGSGLGDASIGQLDILQEIQALKFQRDLHFKHLKNMTDDELAANQALINEKTRQFQVGEAQIQIDALKFSQQTERTTFALEKHSAAEKKEFKIKQIKELYELQVRLDKTLTADQKATLIAAINDLNSIQKSAPQDLFELLNIDLSQEKKTILADSFSFVKDQMKSFLDFQKSIIDQEIQNADRKVQSAEANLHDQISLQAAGYSASVAQATKDLALAKRTQQQALKDRQRLQKTELAINTALEASNLILAVSKALTLGPILGPVAAAFMIASFAAAKIKAFQLVGKQTFRKGGFEEIGGGSHESGKDTFVGKTSKGDGYAERGESVGIFTAKATRRYKPDLRKLVNAANSGTLEQLIIRDERARGGIPIFNNNIDTSGVERRLDRLVEQGKSNSYVDFDGNVVTNDRGRITIKKKAHKF